MSQAVERVLLGTVGVDSGQLIVVDPCYIDSFWIKQDENAPVLGLLFWGRDAEAVAEKLKEMGYEPQLQENGMQYLLPMKQPGSVPDLELQSALETVQRRHPELWVVSAWKHDSTYDQIGDITTARLGGNFLGPLDNAAVAFQSGLGDGEYEVWAEVIDGSIYKIEIVFFDLNDEGEEDNEEWDGR